ncbi:MAG: hypothetical protein FJZ64_02765 [Chlamydiae bacterium]|nr:hypothetical protein [Chlamydiota bacterium]
MKKILWVILLLIFRVNANPPVDLYSIDVSTRGQEFIAALKSAFSLAGSRGEVVIQTMANPPYTYAPGLPSSGIIPYVQNSITAAPNNTLFLVPYNPNGQSGITRNTQYLVIGADQIVTIAYRDTISPPFSLSTPFTSTYPSNVYPLYYINPVHRAADIQSIASTLINFPQNFNGLSGISQVWILTTLTGPYYVPFYRGQSQYIPRVQSISVLSNSLLQITYQPFSSSFAWSVIVSAEQVQQIIFYPTNPPSS